MRGLRKMLNIPELIEDIEYLERRTKKVLREFGIDNLEDYTMESLSGCDLEVLYKTIIEKVLNDNVYVAFSEISNGKYEVIFEFEDNDILSISSYFGDTVEIIVENLISNVIIPHIKRGEHHIKINLLYWRKAKTAIRNESMR